MFAFTLHRSIVRFVSSAPLGAIGVGAVAIVLGALVVLADRSKVKEEQGARMQRTILEEQIARGHQRIEQLEVELPPEQERALRAEKLVAELKGLTSTWSWFGGNREQQRLNRERLAKVEAMQVEAAAKAAALQQELQRLRWEAEALEAERLRIDAMVRAEEERRAGVWHRLGDVWLATRGWILVAAGLYLVAVVVVAEGARRWRSRRAAAV